MKRYGMVIHIKPDKINEYKRLHAAVWPDVLKKIKACHIKNYSIYLGRLGQDEYALFSYFEYHGEDFATDMGKMADDPTTQQWWKLCIPCLNPIEFCNDGELWMNMPEIFHLK